MNKIEEITKSQLRTDIPEFRVGYTVRVNYKIKEGNKERIQAFEGIVMAIQGSGVSKNFIVRKKSQGQNIIDEASTFFKPYFYDLKESKDYNISKLVEYLMGLYPSLGSIKDIYNITMFSILKVINEDKMKSKIGIYEKLMDFLTNIMNLKDNYYTWFLIEDYGKEITKVSGQIKIKEEQVGINIFQIINNNNKNKNKNKIIYGYLCQSIFVNYEIIMIDIDLILKIN